LQAAAERGEIAVFLSASETHNRKNTNKSIEQSLETFSEVVPPALEAGLRVRAYVSTVWGCPYEGDVPLEQSLRIARRLVELGTYQVSLGDTIGVGTPRKTREIVAAFLAEFPRERIALHFHDTRGTALANVLAGLDYGVTTFDSSAGGLGGCPFAPGAAGNLATEDLLFMLNGLGIETGVSLDGVAHASRAIESKLDHKLPSRYLQATAQFTVSNEQ
jgi:hydroxymethylglutaryl-CoA lyase